MGFLMSLFGCGNKATSVSDDAPADEYYEQYRVGDADAFDTEGTVLFDFYFALTATEDDGYREITINEVDKALYINTYSGSNSSELHNAYSATPSLLKDVMDVVYESKMPGWNMLADAEAETGALYVVRFMDKDGKTVRVSNENMPVPEGRAAFSKIEGILNVYLSNVD